MTPQRGKRPERQGLFDFIDSPPVESLYRTAGPSTSRHAAEAVTADGTRARHATIVLRAVEAFPGLTSIELLAHAGELDKYQVRRRLSDLVNAGRLRQGEQRRCRVNGRRMVTWYAV